MNLAETSCCSYLDVFRLFYRQNASHQHRHGASREASGSFGATFSDDSGPPDAPVSVFVGVWRAPNGKFNLKVEGILWVPGLAGNH
mgnify:CR=1 FL=1